MKKFLFIDLDDTLFQTLPKCGGETALRPAAFLPDGTANSFSTARQRAWFDLANSGMTLIPTSARDLASFKRVDLPFTSYTILNFGGLILNPEGEVDSVWQHQLHTEMTLARPAMEELIADVNRYSTSHQLAGQARLVEDGGTPFFVVVKDPEKNLQRLDRIEAEVVKPWAASLGGQFVVHTNGNNLAILPKGLNKARAVAHLSAQLRQQYGEIMTLGMGDSRSDAAFMAACDYAITPRGSQLAAAAFGHL